MSNPSILQNISQILILIGVIFTALGGFGSYYFGKKVETDKETKATLELETAQKERQELKEIMQPFITYAQEKYPTESDNTSLLKLGEDIKNLEEKTLELNERTNEVEKKITIWSLSDLQIKTMVTELKQYKDIEVLIYKENSPDLTPFIDDLKELFNACNWNVKEILVFDEAYNGIKLFGYSEPSEAPPYFLSKLFNLLNQNGVEVKELLRDEKMSKNTIGIQIGKLK